MKIVLMRHGKPDIPEFGKLSASGFQRWIAAYNSASLDTAYKPSQQAIEIANGCNVIVCSDLRRSIESAEMLGVKEINCIDAIFREVELPYTRFSLAKLESGAWFVLYRVLWFMGYAAQCESKSLARQRAAIVADLLHNKALSHSSVFCVGHSIFNSFIAKKLLAKGWQGSASIFSKHWETNEFEYLNS